MSTTTTTGEIIAVDRVGTSHNGNPTCQLTLADGRKFKTKADAQIGYAATNYRPRYGEDATPVELTLEGTRVVGITRTDEEG